MPLLRLQAAPPEGGVPAMPRRRAGVCPSRGVGRGARLLPHRLHGQPGGKVLLRRLVQRRRRLQCRRQGRQVPLLRFRRVPAMPRPARDRGAAQGGRAENHPRGGHELRRPGRRRRRRAAHAGRGGARVDGRGEGAGGFEREGRLHPLCGGGAAVPAQLHPRRGQLRRRARFGAGGDRVRGAPRVRRARARGGVLPRGRRRLRVLRRERRFLRRPAAAVRRGAAEHDRGALFVRCPRRADVCDAERRGGLQLQHGERAQRRRAAGRDGHSRRDRAEPAGARLGHRARGGRQQRSRRHHVPRRGAARLPERLTCRERDVGVALQRDGRRLAAAPRRRQLPPVE
mmetsp:Transcript_27990/g.71792  ORF Transcript_27990/g.71792 Transcript_27990/m.71792 type:complete len:342 (+) Transcript_27990:229-1254(+)